MLKIGSAPIVLAGLQTKFYTGRANATNPQALGKLVTGLNVIALIIQNRLNNLDNSANNVDLLVGTGGGCVWQQLPGTTTELIYCTNLNDVWVKVRQAVTGALAGTGAIDTIVLNAGGADYAVNDILTLQGGDGGTIKVLTIDGAGAILTFSVTNTGQGYQVANGIGVNDVTGVGAGATFNLTAITIDQTDFAVMIYHLDPALQGKR